MPRAANQYGFVVAPADVGLSRDPQSGPTDKVTIDALRLADENITKQLLPLFVLSEAGIPSMIVEIVRFFQPFGSWLIVPEDVSLVPEVYRNGSMTLLTRVDPLFPALVVMDCLRKVTGNDVFQPLEAMCITADGTNLARICDTEQFVLICDVKEAAGDKYYRLSDEKVTEWLAQKHANLAKHPHINHEGATQIISQYLTEPWESALLSSVGSTLKPEPSAATVPQKGKDLAMAIMMQDAKATNRAKRLVERTNNPTSANTKKTKTNSKKARRPSATATNFWNSVNSQQAS